MYDFKKSTFKKRRKPDSLSEQQRFLWKERVAICTIDGGISQERAEQIAWQQIDNKNIDFIF
ncbi:MAG: hypothetical protein A2Y12_06350 [Planctomycetes bacterium GWF2_42_9]|nr:MAG: hypothetical protein A2Y12_06350 [Planctomycetes bacterium GWF2_42_9]